MAKQIIWTQSAKDDLANLISFIGNANDAKNRIRLLFAAVEKLNKFPLNVVKYGDLPNEDLYEIKQSGYRIICKSIDDSVYVMAIVHTLV